MNQQYRKVFIRYLFGNYAHMIFDYLIPLYGIKQKNYELYSENNYYTCFSHYWEQYVNCLDILPSKI